MPIAGEHPPEPYSDPPAPKRFGTVSPLDPELFSTIEECATALIEDRAIGKFTPLEVAEWLDSLAAEGAQRVASAAGKGGKTPSPAFRRLAIDVAIQSGLGRFFAAKLRAGVLFTLHQR